MDGKNVETEKGTGDGWGVVPKDHRILSVVYAAFCAETYEVKYNLPMTKIYVGSRIRGPKVLYSVYVAVIHPAEARSLRLAYIHPMPRNDQFVACCGGCADGGAPGLIN